MTEVMNTTPAEATPDVVQEPKNKGGRPRSDNVKIFAIRITDEDLKHLAEQEQATGLNKTQLVRNAIKGVKSVSRISKTDADMLGQIKRVGENLNQAVLALHTLKKVDQLNNETLLRLQLTVEHVDTLLTDFKNYVLKEVTT